MQEISIIDIARKEIRQNPGSPYYALYAENLLKKGQKQEAYKVLLDGTRANSEYLTGYLVLGNLYFFENQFDKANEIYEHVLKKDPRSLPALYGLAKIAFANGDHGIGVAHLFQLISLDPYNKKILNELSKRREELQKQYIRNAQGQQKESADLLLGKKESPTEATKETTEQIEIDNKILEQDYKFGNEALMETPDFDLDKVISDDQKAEEAEYEEEKAIEDRHDKELQDQLDKLAKAGKKDTSSIENNRKRDIQKQYQEEIQTPKPEAKEIPAEPKQLDYSDIDNLWKTAYFAVREDTEEEIPETIEERSGTADSIEDSIIKKTPKTESKKPEEIEKTPEIHQPEKPEISKDKIRETQAIEFSEEEIEDDQAFKNLEKIRSEKSETLDEESIISDESKPQEPEEASKNPELEIDIGEDIEIIKPDKKTKKPVDLSEIINTEGDDDRLGWIFEGDESSGDLSDILSLEPDENEAVESKTPSLEPEIKQDIKEKEIPEEVLEEELSLDDILETQEKEEEETTADAAQPDIEKQFEETEGEPERATKNETKDEIEEDSLSIDDLFEEDTQEKPVIDTQTPDLEIDESPSDKFKDRPAAADEEEKKEDIADSVEDELESLIQKTPEFTPPDEEIELEGIELRNEFKPDDDFDTDTLDILDRSKKFVPPDEEVIEKAEGIKLHKEFKGDIKAEDTEKSLPIEDAGITESKATEPQVSETKSSKEKEPKPDTEEIKEKHSEPKEDISLEEIDKETDLEELLDIDTEYEDVYEKIEEDISKEPEKTAKEEVKPEIPKKAEKKPQAAKDDSVIKSLDELFDALDLDKSQELKELADKLKADPESMKKILDKKRQEAYEEHREEESDDVSPKEENSSDEVQKQKTQEIPQSQETEQKKNDEEMVSDEDMVSDEKRDSDEKIAQEIYEQIVNVPGKKKHQKPKDEDIELEIDTKEQAELEKLLQNGDWEDKDAGEESSDLPDEFLGEELLEKTLEEENLVEKDKTADEKEPEKLESKSEQDKLQELLESGAWEEDKSKSSNETQKPQAKPEIEDKAKPGLDISREKDDDSLDEELSEESIEKQKRLEELLKDKAWQEETKGPETSDTDFKLPEDSDDEISRLLKDDVFKTEKQKDDIPSVESKKQKSEAKKPKTEDQEYNQPVDKNSQKDLEDLLASGQWDQDDIPDERKIDLPGKELLDPELLKSDIFKTDEPERTKTEKPKEKPDKTPKPVKEQNKEDAPKPEKGPIPQRQIKTLKLDKELEDELDENGYENQKKLEELLMKGRWDTDKLDRQEKHPYSIEGDQATTLVDSDTDDNIKKLLFSNVFEEDKSPDDDEHIDSSDIITHNKSRIPPGIENHIPPPMPVLGKKENKSKNIDDSESKEKEHIKSDDSSDMSKKSNYKPNTDNGTEKGASGQSEIDAEMAAAQGQTQKAISIYQKLIKTVGDEDKKRYLGRIQQLKQRL